MKKVLCLLISVMLLFTYTASAFATNSSSKVDTKKRLLLQKANIDINMVTILDETDVFSKEELEKMKAEDEELAKQGLIKDSVVYFIPNEIYQKPSLNTNITVNAMAITIPTRTVSAIRQYNSPTTTLNDNSQGMRYWVNVAFNLTIGTITKYAWMAATILGVNPGSLNNGWVTGDALTNHFQYVYNDTITQGQNPRDSQWYSVVRTTKLVLTNYVDLYTLDTNNNPVRKSSSSSSTYYTQHYSDGVWKYNEAAVNVYYCGMAITYDVFE